MRKALQIVENLKGLFMPRPQEADFFVLVKINWYSKCYMERWFLAISLMPS